MTSISFPKISQQSGASSMEDIEKEFTPLNSLTKHIPGVNEAGGISCSFPDSVLSRVRDTMRLTGLTTVFGNPGSTELSFLHNWPDDFRYFLCLHEGVCMEMALGYTVATNKACMVNLHTTAGSGNAMGGIVNSFHSHAPIVITAGQQHREMLRMEPYLSGRQLEFVKPYVKWAIEPSRALDVPEVLYRAYHIAMTEPRGPVFVSIPMDDLSQRGCDAVVARNVSYVTLPDPNALMQAATTILGSKNIAIIAGEESDEESVWPLMIQLAEHLSATIFSPAEGYRVAFPSGHKQYAGPLPPAQKETAERLAPFDTVLVIGTHVFQYYPHSPGNTIKEGTHVIQITNDPSSASRALVGQSIIGNVNSAIESLLMGTAQYSKEEHGKVSPTAQKWHDVPSLGEIEAVSPLKPQYVYASLSKVLPPHIAIFEEAFGSKQTLHKYVPINEPRSLMSTASGSLGVAMPSSVGFKIGNPSRPVLCVVGDGSVHYANQALWTAARYKVKVVFLVMNNTEYSVLKSFCNFTNSPGVPGLDVPGVDFLALAKAYGVAGCRVNAASELEPALTKAFSDTTKDSYLIDVNISREISPLLG